MEKTDGKGSFFWVETHNEQTPIPVKQKRKSKSKKVEFVGWGSKLLIDFLQSIGKDSGKQLTQYDVTAIVNEYVHTFNLLNPMKKKRVDCDERLHSLFGKKSIPRNKIHELLNTHFAENNDSSEDEVVYSSDELDDVNTKYKKRKVSSTEKKAPVEKKKASETQLLSCFASIIPENVKLLYLKKSLVEELVKQPESLQRKLLGSYIRIKSDPNDYSQKNSHQLHPVTGVKNVARNGDVHVDVLLQVPNMIKDIPISMLSDQDFSKEECEDLCQRVKDGLLKRPTVVEVEQKAQMLREDIMKHWLPRELAYLQNLIDRANEKGWRKELFEYLERKKLLQNPEEQSKLFTEVLKVTADKLEPEATPQELVEDIKQLNGLTNPSADKLELEATEHEHIQVIKQLNSSINSVLPSHGSDTAEDEVLVLGGAVENNAEPVKKVGNGQHLTGFQWVEVEQKHNIKSLDRTLDLNNVIELSDDEEETHEPEKEKEKEKELELSSRKWFYLDPQGNIQGPFSRNELKLWNDAGYFLPDFKAWLLDQFGVLHDGKQPYPAAISTLQKLAANGAKMIIISNSSRRASTTLDKLNTLGFDPSLFVGAVTSGELTYQHLQRREDPWFQALGKTCIHMTWSDRGAISLDGLGLQVVENVEQAEFILVHGTEALGLSSGDSVSKKVEELEKILEKCAAKGIPMVVANPDFVTVEARELRIMPGTLAASYEKLGGEVKWMGKPYPIIYKSAMDMAGVDASDSIAVGDSLHHDIKGANASGIESAFITCGIHSSELGLSGFGEVADLSSVKTLASKYNAYPSYVLASFSW